MAWYGIRRALKSPVFRRFHTIVRPINMKFTRAMLVQKIGTDECGFKYCPHVSRWADEYIELFMHEFKEDGN